MSLKKTWSFTPPGTRAINYVYFPFFIAGFIIGNDGFIIMRRNQPIVLGNFKHNSLVFVDMRILFAVLEIILYKKSHLDLRIVFSNAQMTVW